MYAAAILASMLAAVSPDAAETCDSLAIELGERLDRTKMAMEPESALSSIYQRATEANARCSDSESLAYLRLRSAELGRGTAVGRQPESARRAWRDLARDLATKFPRSVRIATVQARATGSVAEAKRAVSLDGSYAPAQVALAAALVSVDAQQALGCLKSVKILRAVSDGFTVLARARFAAHDLAGAVKAAQMTFRGRDLDLVEPDARDPRPISGAHEILGLVYLQKRDFAKAAKHLKLAAIDSETARTILENPPGGLKAAIRNPSP